ncbi:MAG TPA: hypothetical protein VMU51_03810 [Mycobacteriales bacterium]|nr:hypothetical protein [Mycobacteriales bacterium]
MRLSLINCKSTDTVPTNRPDETLDAQSAPNLAPRSMCDDNTTTNQPTSSSPKVTPAVLQIPTQDVAQQPPDDALRVAHEWLVLEPPQVYERRAGRKIGDGLLHIVEERVKELRYLDDRLAGGDTHELVSRELNTTLTLMKKSSYTETVGRRLSSVAGELAQLAGWVASDAGLHSAASDYYLLGAQSARAAGNDAVTANNLSSLAYQIANIGKPTDAVLLARSAASRAQKEPAIVQALLLERVAWAHAKAGESRATERALGQVEDALARDRTDDDPPWLYWLDTREADVMAGRCYTELRRPLRAAPLLERATATYPEDAHRELALYLSWLAIAYADAREVEEACRVTHRVLELTRNVHSARTDMRLSAVLGRLSEFAGTQPVKDLWEAARHADAGCGPRTSGRKDAIPTRPAGGPTGVPATPPTGVPPGR